MEEYRWSSFEKKIHIDAPIPEVYRCFATGTGMESWFLRQCLYTDAHKVSLKPGVEAKAGDLYTFIWHGWPDDVAEKGHVIEANGRDTFGFTFTGNGATDMKILIKLSTEKGLCCVRLKQYDIPEDEKARSKWHLGCLEGWLFYLINLKSILEGGIDLRNKDMALTGVINA